MLSLVALVVVLIAINKSNRDLVREIRLSWLAHVRVTLVSDRNSPEEVLTSDIPALIN